MQYQARLKISQTNPSTSNILPILILGTFAKVCHSLVQQQDVTQPFAGGTLAVVRPLSVWCAIVPQDTVVWQTLVEQKRNVMAHAQKPDLVFQRNGRVHLYQRGCQFSRLLAAEVCASAVVMLDRPCPIQCTTAGYPLHLPFSPSLLHPCVSVCHHIQFLL